jgi:hypothetical protein
LLHPSAFEGTATNRILKDLQGKFAP